jgi:hypothetical protein
MRLRTKLGELNPFSKYNHKSKGAAVMKGFTSVEKKWLTCVSEMLKSTAQRV